MARTKQPGDVEILHAGIILHVRAEGWDPGRVNTGRRYVLHVDPQWQAEIVGRDNDPRYFGGVDSDAAGDLVEAGLLERAEVEPGVAGLLITERLYHAVRGHLRLEGGRGWERWGGRVPMPYPRFESLEAFHLDVPARESSGEVDFGVAWCDGPDDWPQYRVSWVEATGEVYAVRLAPPCKIEVLGLARTRDEVEARLAGWADQEDWPSQLAWVRERLAQAPVEAQ